MRVQLIKNGKKIAAFVPRDGCLNYVDENVSLDLTRFGGGFRKFRVEGALWQGALQSLCPFLPFLTSPPGLPESLCGVQQWHEDCYKEYPSPHTHGY